MSVPENAIVGFLKQADTRVIRKVLNFVAKKYNLRIYGIEALGRPQEIDCLNCLYSKDDGNCSEECKENQRLNSTFCSECAYNTGNCNETDCKEHEKYKKHELLSALRTLEKI